MNYTFKSKEQLDTMSKKEIKDYRYDIIKNGGGKKVQSDLKHYIEELEVYTKIRFKKDEFDMYNRWVELAKSGDETYKMMSKMVETEEGKERMYNFSMSSSLEKIGDFKYITGLEINIDSDMDSFVKLLNDKTRK
jgi:predicted RNA methylase